MSRRDVAVPVALAALVFAVGCQSAPEREPTLHRVDDSPAPHIDPADPFRSPAPPAPANDIPESDRIEFHEKHTLTPLVPIPGDARPMGPAARRESESPRAAWWPPLSPSRASPY